MNIADIGLGDGRVGAPIPGDPTGGEPGRGRRASRPALGPIGVLPRRWAIAVQLLALAITVSTALATSHSVRSGAEPILALSVATGVWLIWTASWTGPPWLPAALVVMGAAGGVLTLNRPRFRTAPMRVAALG